jgi:hypothetical protein
MPSTPLDYRLRLRNADDTADILTITMGGTSAYLADVPQVDGSSFDPLTGRTQVGQASVLVADPLTAPGVRVFTAVLGDASGKSQLLGRRAFLEVNRGTGFAPYFSGYVTAVNTVDAITYSVTLAHTTRDDEVTRAWATTDYPHFAARSWLFGGPVSADMPSTSPTARVTRSQGQWRATVVAVRSTYVHLDIQENTSSAFPPEDLTDALRDRGTIRLNSADFYRNVFKWARANAQRYFVRGFPSAAAETEWTSPPAGAFPVAGYMPRVDVVFTQRNSTPISHTAPMMGGKSSPSAVAGVGYQAFSAPVFEDLGNHFYVAWAATDSTPQPNVGDTLTFYAQARDVSDASPAWLVGHPVTILRDLLVENGYPVDAASVATATAGVGTVTLALRVTTPPTLADAIASLCGPFGLGVRIAPNGTRVIFCWRTRTPTAPTIGYADLADAAPLWWATDEASQVRQVLWKHQRFERWPGVGKDRDSTNTGDRPLDGVVVVGEEMVSTSAATVRPTARQVTWDIPGALLASTGAQLRSVRGVVERWAEQTFGIYAHGAVTTELAVLPTVTADVGDEVVLELPPRPGLFSGQTPTAKRGTPERCLVIGRTPQPWGATLRLLRVAEVGPAPDGDPGDGTTFPILSTAFTALKSVANPTRDAVLTLTTPGPWATVAQAQVEYVEQTAAPDDGAAWVRWPDRWTVATPLTVGPLTGNRVVWFRVRPVLLTNEQAGAWSLPQSVTLDAAARPVTPTLEWSLNSTTGQLTVTVQGDDAAVSARLVASTTGFPTLATMLTGTLDTTLPFTYPNVITLSAGQIAYIGALTFDAGGNRSIPAYAAVNRDGSSVLYTQCLAVATSSTPTSITVTVTGTAPAGTPTVQLVGVTGSAVRTAGALPGVAVASGSQWTFQRGPALGLTGGAQFRAVLTNAQSDDDYIEIPEQGRDTVYLTSRARVTGTSNTQVFVRYQVADQYNQFNVLNIAPAGSLSVVNTTTPHNLTGAVSIVIAGNSNAAFNGTWSATVLNSMAFTIPTTGGGVSGTGGTVTPQQYVSVSHSATGVGTVTATGTTVTPVVALNIPETPAASYVDFTINRPLFEQGAGRVVFLASAAGRISDTDAVDVPTIDKDFSPPVFAPTFTLNSTTGVVSWATPAAGVQVEAKTDSGSYSVQAGTSYTVTRNAPGGASKLAFVKAVRTATGIESTVYTFTVPAQDGGGGGGVTISNFTIDFDYTLDRLQYFYTLTGFNSSTMQVVPYALRDGVDIGLRPFSSTATFAELAADVPLDSSGLNTYEWVLYFDIINAAGDTVLASSRRVGGQTFY